MGQEVGVGSKIYDTGLDVSPTRSRSSELMEAASPGGGLTATPSTSALHSVPSTSGSALPKERSVSFDVGCASLENVRNVRLFFSGNWHVRVQKS
eukprot:5540623-Pyramimonas_sp.AAC.1